MKNNSNKQTQYNTCKKCNKRTNLSFVNTVYINSLIDKNNIRHYEPKLVKEYFYNCICGESMIVLNIQDISQY